MPAPLHGQKGKIYRSIAGCSHLDARQVTAGDTVIGTLPVHIAADICSRGARFFFLELHLELNQRGVELTESDMLKANCSVKEYFVHLRPGTEIYVFVLEN